MDTSLRVRLSTMMFLEYFLWGAWSVPLVGFLSALPSSGGLGFPGSYVAMIYATTAIGAMISPLFIGLFADRLFATEKVLAVLHLGGAALLGFAAYSADRNRPQIQSAFEQAAREYRMGDSNLFQALKDQDANAPDEETQKRINKAVEEVNKQPAVAQAVSGSYQPLFALMMVYALCYMPTVTLTNSLSFRNLSDPDKYFGGIRVLGTIGWIIAGWVVGFGMNAISAQPLYLAAAGSAVLGVFSLALPHTPPSRESKTLGETLGLPALEMLKDRSFLVFFICSFLICIPLTFYYTWTFNFLVHIHVPHASAVQTLGQISEIFFMLVLSVCLLKFGTKWMLVFGMLAWCLRYAIFAWQNTAAVVAVGLPLHGICYDFFFVVSYLYVDRQAPRQLRASAQGLITFITLGAGMFVGNLVGGAVKDHFTVGDQIEYGGFWLVPLAIAAACTLLFAAFFRDSPAMAAGVPLSKALEGLEPVEPPEQVH